MTTITFQEFQRILYDQPKKMEKLLKKEGVILGLRAERYAKRNATTFPKVWTGRLRASIMPEPLPFGQFGFLLRAGGQRIAGTAGEDRSPKDVEYAARIEFGHQIAKVGGVWYKSQKGIWPRKFMGRALQKVQKEDLPETLRQVVKFSLGGSDASDREHSNEQDQGCDRSGLHRWVFRV